MLVMNTPFGKLTFNRLPFGLKVSSQIFAKNISIIFGRRKIYGFEVVFIEWIPQEDQEFEHVKIAINNAPSLFHFDKHRKLILQCDASRESMGAVTKWSPFGICVSGIHCCADSLPQGFTATDKEIRPYFGVRHNLHLWYDLLCMGSAIVDPKTQWAYIFDFTSMNISHTKVCSLPLFRAGLSIDIQSSEPMLHLPTLPKIQDTRANEIISITILPMT
ncbi:retrotransposon [Cordylochernes scorpioides]|uniref:Retrotransposon n=1 Tax=Cordylochernes scorpioides TaxID=51811 RepID=A0ABY6KSZ7_9ARAC|nr:retrotransposon [Cordylochernes scorpioides]